MSPALKLAPTPSCALAAYAYEGASVLRACRVAPVLMLWGARRLPNRAWERTTDLDYRALAFVTALSYLADDAGNVRTTWTEAAARVGVDECTVRRWRARLERSGVVISTDASGEQKDTLRVRLPAFALVEPAFKHWMRGAWSPELRGADGEPIGPIARLVYAALLVHKRGDSRAVNPSTRRIAAMVCLGKEDAVSRAIAAELVPAELVRVVTPGRAGVSTVYAVLAPRTGADPDPGQRGGVSATEGRESKSPARGVCATAQRGRDTPGIQGGNPGHLGGDTPGNEGAQEEESAEEEEEEGETRVRAPDLPSLRDLLREQWRLSSLSPADADALDAFVADQGDDGHRLAEIMIASVANDNWRMERPSRRRPATIFSKIENVDAFLWNTDEGKAYVQARREEEAHQQLREQAARAERARDETARQERAERIAAARLAFPDLSDEEALAALKKQRTEEGRRRHAEMMATKPTW